MCCYRLSKTSEILRRLEGKSIATGTKFGEYAKTVIGIDLATQLLGISFDIKTAQNGSGLGKTDYARYKRTISTVLDLIQTVDIPKICVQLGLTHVQNTAEKLFDEYRQFYTKNNGNESDLSHPQYAAMAVHLACRKEKVKLPKSSVMAFSHLKAQQWETLEKSWNKSCAQMQVQKAIDKKVVEHITVEKPTGTIEGNHIAEQKTSQNGRCESYDAFRERILQEAFEKACASNDITFLRVHVLAEICNLSAEQEKNAQKLLRLYIMTICSQKEAVLNPKYSALAVFNATKYDDEDVDVNLIIKYSRMTKVQWSRFFDESESKLNSKDVVMCDSSNCIIPEDFKSFEGLYAA